MANKAVLCGINQYQTQTDLRGCLNDVDNLSSLLTQSFAFDPANIHSLRDEQVTKRAIEKEYNWLIRNVHSGDQLVFHFSGHGSYVPDDQGDESDGADEILCLYNMDFYNPETYIRDDEWQAMIERVPDGVHLTFIFDSCHSGTGTRSITVNVDGNQQTLLLDTETATQRGLYTPLTVSRSGSESDTLDSAEYQQLVQEQSVILPRFLPPPPEFDNKIRSFARSGTLRTTVLPLEKHLLLAGCRDDQTSADAYIDNNFNGAFTYYLCQTLRENPNLGSQQTIQQVTQQLTNNHFFQEPQHEGQPRIGSLFGQSSSNTVISDNDMLDSIPDPRNVPNLTPENQKLLIEAYIKLLDTLGGTGGLVTEDKEITLRRTANRYLVYVHGIGTHPKGYSEDWWNALKPFVPAIFGDGSLNDTRREVFWSDLVNQKSRSLGDIAQEEQLRREIELILEERRKQMIAEQTGGGQAARQAIQAPTARGEGLSWDDFLVYMVNPTMRQNILKRFTEVVQPLLASGAEIDIISHSWGTVVSYEGLRELEQLSLSGRVNAFFTVGSALSLGPVRIALRSENKNGRRPTMVNQWINLDAKGDLVGGLLGDQFEVNQEYLKLEPTGCPGFLGIYNLVCAHSSYFDRRNLTVNDDIFARYING